MGKKTFLPENWILSVCKVPHGLNENDTIDCIYSPSRVIFILRHLNGLTQQDLANASSQYFKHVSQSYISNIEKMQTVPTYITILHLCSIFSIEPKRFFDYVFETQHMTWKETALFIGKDFKKDTLKRKCN